jgi:hypothetical protein
MRCRWLGYFPASGTPVAPKKMLASTNYAAMALAAGTARRVIF